MTASPTNSAPLERTPLHALHVELGARMVPFAGYSMPVQYPSGIVAEHLHTRAAAGLFDVSHMGQAVLIGPDHAATAKALEGLVPADIAGLAPGRMRYTQITNPDGGIVDDLMVTRPRPGSGDGRLMLVVNASRKADDRAWFEARLPAGVRYEPAEGRGLLALQGPQAAAVLARHCPSATELAFMEAAAAVFDGTDCHVSRSGYTGEDGFEISVPERHLEAVAQALLAEPEVKPAGLGARDSLRLEAGLCLYGHDIDGTTSPVEAGLSWSIGRRRRQEGGFTGEGRILAELAGGPRRRRVGIRPEGRVPAREGTAIETASGERIGTVTSGGYGPTFGGPVAMGYVNSAHAAPGTAIRLIVRDRPIAAAVVPLPFVPHSYKR